MAQLSSGVPVALEVPLEPRHTALEGVNSLLGRLSARLLRVRQSLGHNVRLVEVRPITRFALEGGLPRRLVDLAGIMALTERHLLFRARNIYEVHHHALDEVLSNPEHTPERLTRSLEALRIEMEEEIQLATREVDRLADETVRVAESALGHAWRHWLTLTADAGTPLLPRRSYRFSRIFDERRLALAHIQNGLAASRAITRALANTQAMELELIRFQEGLTLGIENRGEALARDLRSRVVAPASRLLETLTSGIDQLRPAIEDAATTAQGLATLLQAALAPVNPTVEEALGISEGFRSALRTDAELEPLITDLHAHVDELTDRFEITEQQGLPVGRGLPETADARDVHFRDVVRQYMDVQVGRNLHDWSKTLLERVEAIYTAMEEIQRSLGFNMELALTEVAVLPDGPLPSVTRKLLDELLLNALQRQAAVLAEATEAGQEHSHTIRGELHDLVMDHARELQTLVVAGRWSEVRLRLVRGQVARRRQQLTRGETPLAKLKARADQTTEQWLGPELAHSLKVSLGLPNPHLARPLGPHCFVPPTSRLKLPAVYRRLLSDPALQAGDLLLGRDSEVERVRQTLLGQGAGVSRAVGLVGTGGPGQGSVANAILRGLSPERISRHTLRTPVTVDQVDFLVSQATSDTIMVIEGLHWLVSMDRDGLAPLRRLLSTVVANDGRNGWLLSGRLSVWNSLEPVVALRDVFPLVLDLAPLSLEELRRALLSRQAMSGFGLAYVPQVPTLQQRVLDWIRKTDDSPEQESFFRQLHRRSGGVLEEAERLWAASIDGLDNRRSLVTLGAVPPGPEEDLARLPDEDLLTLRLVSRSGRVTADQHARWLRWADSRSEAHLARLHHWGLLEKTSAGHVLAPMLAGSIERRLRHQGWLP